MVKEYLTIVVTAKTAAANQSSRRSRSQKNTTSAMPKAIGMTRCPKTPSRMAAISPTTAVVTASLTGRDGPARFAAAGSEERGVMLLFTINAGPQRHEPGWSAGSFGFSKHREPAGA